MRVIFDTNVVVSAVLRDRDPEAVILFVVEHPDFQWLASPDILAEYAEVLRRPKFGLPDETVRKWLSLFETLITVVEVEEHIDFPRDRKDAKFLECVLATDAEYFVTGDRDFEEAGRMENTAIVSVSQFKSLVCDAW